jgi:hypothetical protein
VIEFHTVEGCSMVGIFRCLRSVCGEDALDVSSVRHWVHCFKSSEKDIVDRSCSQQLAVEATCGTVKESC